MILQSHWSLRLFLEYTQEIRLCSPDCFSQGSTHRLGTRLQLHTVTHNNLVESPSGDKLRVPFLRTQVVLQRMHLLRHHIDGAGKLEEAERSLHVYR